MPDRLIANSPDAYLSPGTLLNRLKTEFSYVEADAEVGRRHVLETIERLKADYSPRHPDLHMAERLERVKDRALYVCFGDESGSELGLLDTYVIPGNPLVFEYASVEHEHAARDLLARCAAVLGYVVIKDRRTIHDPGYAGTERRGLKRERRLFVLRRVSPKDRRSP